MRIFGAKNVFGVHFLDTKVAPRVVLLTSMTHMYAKHDNVLALLCVNLLDFGVIRKWV